MKLRKNNLKKIVDEVVASENVFKKPRERKYTVKDELMKLGKHVGVQYRSVLKWYNNTRQPRFGNMYGVAKFYKVPIEKLYYLL